MGGAEDTAGPLRERVFDAVLEELTVFGIDKFSADRVIRRSGVPPEAIRNQWRDDRVLLMDALITRSDQTNPCPDTGRLGDDLRVLADALVQLNQSETARQLTRRMLPGGRDTDFGEVGSDVLAARFESLKPIFRRAAERGELRAGVDPDDATRMCVAACLHDPLFHDEPVRPDYADQLRDVFLHGILAPARRDPSLTADVESREQLRLRLRATVDAMIDPVALVEAVRDVDGRITDFTFREVNPAACADLGCSRADVIGASLVGTVPGIASSGLLAHYIHSVQTGEPMAVQGCTVFGPRSRESRRYDVRGGRAGADWLSTTWREVT